MSVETHEIETVRGDRIVVTLFMHPGERPSIMVTIDDVDESLVPTAELTIPEAADLREALRKLSEATARATIRGHWR